MKLAALLAPFAFLASLSAQTVATVPVTLDHNRVIIDVRFPMPDGSSSRFRAWVDNGNPDMLMTERLARKLGLQLTGEIKEAKELRVQRAEVPREIHIGTFVIQPSYLKEAKVLLGRTSIGPGSSAEINIPSTILRNYDVSVDYRNREFTIGPPGSVRFSGITVPAQINPQNGLIQVASEIAGIKSNLALDFGASYSFLSADAIAQLSKAHPEWPHMTGAVGTANMWGEDDEVHAQLLRLPSLKFGAATLTQVGVESLTRETLEYFQTRAGISTLGLIGANALSNYKVGLDYAHSTIYLDPTSKTTAPDMDVVGLTLRPEPNEKYTIVGVAELAGKPSAPGVLPGDTLVKIDGIDVAGGTMGQAWSLLGGVPGDIRELELDREGKKLTVKAPVVRFLQSASVHTKVKKSR